MSALAQSPPRTGRPQTAPAHGLRVVDRASNAVCALALALLVVLLLGSLAGYRPLVEYSGSMHPTIDAGDLLITRTAPALSIHPGAIVTFNDPALHGRLVTHRVVAVHGSRARLQFLTRGDANATPERWSVSRAGEVDVVRARIPEVGRATAWMTDTLARTVALPLLVFALSVALLSRIWRA
ncbi:MAG TPA: signal peptidase I [Solirubrobacteraceae bacterium]|nr:signal peptidase I [Solirubrobacteraceae bacterium]